MPVGFPNAHVGSVLSKSSKFQVWVPNFVFMSPVQIQCFSEFKVGRVDEREVGVVVDEKVDEKVDEEVDEKVDEEMDEELRRL